MKILHPLLIENCNNLINYVNENTPCLDVTDLCKRYTANNIASCSLGIEGNSFKQDRSDLMAVGDGISNCAFAAAKQSISLFLPTVRKLLGVT